MRSSLVIATGIFVLLLGLTPGIAKGQGEDLYNDDILHEIRFTGFDTTRLDGSKKYQPVALSIDGTTIDSIGVKEKGNTSNGVPNLKVPLKIKTNKYVKGREYDGVREFTLHNNYQDPTMMREKITYEVCRDMGLLALRTAYARVYINDEYWGLYTVVEGKDELFEHRLGNDDADAIETLDLAWMCYLGENQADYENEDLPRYKLENGNGETAWPRFIRMLKTVSEASDEEFIETASRHLNLRDFYTYIAVNVYLMNFDSYIAFNGNQIYAFDSTQKVWQVVPWDFNASINLWTPESNQVWAASYPMIPRSVENGCIASRIATVPEARAYYLEAMCRISQTLCDPTTMDARIDLLRDQIRTAVHDDWRKVSSSEEFDRTIGLGHFEEYEGLKTFFRDRSVRIAEELRSTNHQCGIASVTDQRNTNDADITLSIVGTDLLLRSERKVARADIYDVAGRRVITITDPQSPINIRTLSSGIYLVLVEGETPWSAPIVVRR